MPQRVDFPNARERAAMQLLLGRESRPIHELPAGPTVISNLLNRGWITRLASAGAGAGHVVVTEAGRIAFEAQIPVPGAGKKRNPASAISA